ncbi:hypothetical protein GCM10023238_18540 [Streptomyces heliomycini]
MSTRSPTRGAHAGHLDGADELQTPSTEHTVDLRPRLPPQAHRPHGDPGRGDAAAKWTPVHTDAARNAQGRQDEGRPHDHGGALVAAWGEDPCALAWSVRLQPIGQGDKHPVRIADFSIDGNVAFGAVEGDRQDETRLDIIKGIPFADFELSGNQGPAEQGQAAAPGAPQQGRRLRPQLRRPREGAGQRGTRRPFAFFKPSTSVIGPGDEIQYPSFPRRCTTRPSWPW